jgi:hypothetical protein
VRKVEAEGLTRRYRDGTEAREERRMELGREVHGETDTMILVEGLGLRGGKESF